MKTICLAIFSLLTTSCTPIDTILQETPGDTPLEIIENQEMIDFRYSTVFNGIAAWKSWINFDISKTPKNFMIYFTDKTCNNVPEFQLLCQKYYLDRAAGVTFISISQTSGRIDAAYIYLYNEYFHKYNDHAQLKTLVAHELGHVYGLTHYDERPCVMSTYINDSTLPDEEYIYIMQRASLGFLPVEYADRFYTNLLPPINPTIYLDYNSLVEFPNPDIQVIVRLD